MAGWHRGSSSDALAPRTSGDLPGDIRAVRYHTSVGSGWWEWRSYSLHSPRIAGKTRQYLYCGCRQRRPQDLRSLRIYGGSNRRIRAAAVPGSVFRCCILLFGHRARNGAERTNLEFDFRCPFSIRRTSTSTGVRERASPRREGLFYSGAVSMVSDRKSHVATLFQLPAATRANTTDAPDQPVLDKAVDPGLPSPHRIGDEPSLSGCANPSRESARLHEIPHRISAQRSSRYRPGGPAGWMI